MKKLKALLSIIIFPTILFSQSNEFSINYSPLSVYKLGHGVEEGLTETNHKVLGAITFDYYHYLNEKIKLGICLMYDQEQSEGTVDYGPIDFYEKENQVFTLAPQLDFEYLNNENFKLSSGLSVGYAFNKSEGTEGLDLHEGINGFTFHLNLISFRWGKNNGLCGYMGLGYKGFLGLGYFVRI